MTPGSNHVEIAGSDPHSHGKKSFTENAGYTPMYKRNVNFGDEEEIVSSSEAEESSSESEWCSSKSEDSWEEEVEL